uniref:Uncharacterized protein n=1 Tax=Lepeophtheirus salmonis TaxID=72036 RepID=A0A0K2U8I4_LEPSM
MILTLPEEKAQKIQELAPKFRHRRSCLSVTFNKQLRKRSKILPLSSS